MARFGQGLQERGVVGLAASLGENGPRGFGRVRAIGRNQPRGDEQPRHQDLVRRELCRQQARGGELSDRLSEPGAERDPLAQLHEVDDELAVDQPAAQQLGVERAGGRLVLGDLGPHRQHVVA